MTSNELENNQYKEYPKEDIKVFEEFEPQKKFNIGDTVKIIASPPPGYGGKWLFETGVIKDIIDDQYLVRFPNDRGHWFVREDLERI